MDYKRHKTNVLFVLFTLLQPLIDVITTATIQWGLPLSFGILIRVAYLFALLIWLTTFIKRSPAGKKVAIYLVGFFVLMGASFIMNYLTKDPFHLVAEFTFYVKIIYFQVLLLGFYLMFSEMRQNQTDLRQLLVTYFTIIGGFMGTVFLVSFLTGTSIKNYEWVKFGTKGWFTAGNEIGAALAILLPITALFALLYLTNWKKLYVWVPFLLVAFGMLQLGTKVGYGGILVSLVASFILSACFWLFKKKSVYRKQYQRNTIVTSILLAALILLTPYTSIYYNMFAQIEMIETSTMEVYDRYKDKDKGEGQNEEGKSGQLTQGQLEGIIYSSRDYYLEQFIVDYKEAPLVQQILGMGYSGNYTVHIEGEKNPVKLIEMDFFDVFFTLGWLGFTYYMLPMLYFVIVYLIRFLSTIQNRMTYFDWMTGLSFVLGIGVATMAGHVFTAPAVSIYMAFLLALLYVDSSFVNLSPKKGKVIDDL